MKEINDLICWLINFIIPVSIVITSFGAVFYGIKYKKIKIHKHKYEWIYTFVIIIYILWGLLFLFILIENFLPIFTFFSKKNHGILIMAVRPLILLTTSTQYVLNKLKYLKTIHYRNGGKNK